MNETLRTRRWRGILVVVLAPVGLGLLGRRPELVLLGAVGAVFAAYPWVTGPPTPTLSLDRRLSEPDPAPGEAFEVTTTIRNEGRRPLFDVRVVDGVPPALPVTDGTPRHGTSLLAGETATFQYTVNAQEGRHAFDPATVVVRDASGEHEVEVAVESDTAIDCRSKLAGAPLATQTLPAAGRVGSDEGGSGVEFHRTRAYRPGDPMTDIDWNRFARTAELTTIDYREERATAVVVLVDAREACYRGPTDEPHGVARSVAAAQQLVDELLGARNRVGLAAFGRADCWLAPDTGRSHRARLQRLLTDHEALSLSPPTETEPIGPQLETLRRRLPPNAQVIYCTPLLDDDAVNAARRLDAEGHSVTVLSPDVTETESPGTALAGVEREARLAELRRADVSVVDWDRRQQLAIALSEAPRAVVG